MSGFQFPFTYFCIMAKAMLFIDGSWLYHVRPYLLNLDGRQDFELDYKALPVLVKEYLSSQLEMPIDMVRTYYFGTLAINKPGHDNVREKQFYEMLNKRCNYHTEIFEYDFKKIKKFNAMGFNIVYLRLYSFDNKNFLLGNI